MSTLYFLPGFSFQQLRGTCGALVLPLWIRASQTCPVLRICCRDVCTSLSAYSYRIGKGAHPLDLGRIGRKMIINCKQKAFYLFKR